MDEERFLALCRAAGERVQPDNPGQLARTGEMELDGVRIGLFFDSTTDKGIHCYVDLGTVGESERARVFHRALALNLTLEGAHGESLAFDEESGRLVLRSLIRSGDIANGAQLAGAQLADWLRQYADFAHAFRMRLEDAASGLENASLLHARA